ncbi:MAG: methyltransferase, partial [Armatimonadetes bacterium]|nr:methyltransferase [Armatimonadota bacterium]
MTTTTEVTPSRILQLGLGFWGAKALLSAVELGVFTELGQGPLTAESLRARLGLHERAALDFFDALVALGMLERHDGVYSNTPETDLFLDRAKPSYLGGVLEMANQRLWSAWGGLTDGLRSGRPQNELRESGENIFDELYSNPAALKSFLQAMTGISMGAAHAIAQKFPWDRHRTFIDVGGAQGCLPVVVARAHPHLTGGSFDLPQVQPVFEEYVRAHGLHERLKFHAGDFFKDRLPPADVYVMGHILHDWGLADKKRLIASVYDALPEGGAFIVYEALIDNDRRTNAFGLLMSLNMLVETPDGFDYSGADCQKWMREAGFRETRVEHLVGPDGMVVGVK